MNEQLARQQLADYIRNKVKISEEELAIITSSYRLLHFKKKEFFIKEGTECKFQGFVVAGTFRVFYLDERALEHVLYFGFKDWWVGDVASFMNNEPAKLNVQAMEDGYLLAIDIETQEALFDKVPVLDRLFRIITQRTMAVLQKRLLMSVSASAEQRYHELLERHPGIEQLVPQHQIASYLGILPESLSRMKKQIIERRSKS